MKRVVLGLAALAALTTAALVPARAEPAAPLAPIASLDVARYMGTWYEIAKYPNRFQRQCAGHSTAQYAARSDGRVDVVNRCRKADGTSDDATGVARPVGEAGTPKLEVRFAPAWLSFLPWVWGDYWVIDLDPGYTLAAVSEPGRDYLWILSRTPTVDSGAYQALLRRLEAKGFDITRLQATPQD